MRLFTLFLCFIGFCGNVYSQSVQETISTKYSPWSVNAFSLMSSELSQADQGGLLNSYNYVGPNYRLNSNERIAFKMAFNANTTGHDDFNGECVQDMDASFANPFLEYNNYGLGLLPGFADMFWSARIYFPMSKSSRRKKEIAQYKSNLILTHWVSQKFLIEFRNDMRFYHQSKTTYTGTHTEECRVVDNRNPSNTKKYRMDNWVSFWYRVNPIFSVGFSSKLREEGYNRTSAFDTSRQRFGRMQTFTASIGPSLRYTVNNNYNFILSLSDKIEYSGFKESRQGDLSELGKFRKENLELALLSFIRF